MSINKLLKSYYLTTPKQIYVSVKSFNKFFRSGQQISKFESKVHFKSGHSNFLYYTLIAAHDLNRFNLVLVEKGVGSSEIYLGYYDDEDEHIIDSVSTNPEWIPVTVPDVIDRPDDHLLTLNSTSTPTYSSTDSLLTEPPINATSGNTTDIPGAGKKNVYKAFYPVLTLKKEEEYFIEVAWKSNDPVTSVSMPTSDTLTYTMATSTSLPEASIIHHTVPENTTQTSTPTTLAKIPENVFTQIIVRNKDKKVLKELNLDINLERFSFSDADGKLLEYEVDGSKIILKTNVYKENIYRQETWKWFLSGSPVGQRAEIGVLGLVILPMMLQVLN